MKLLVKLLTIPLDTLSISVLDMDEFPTLMDYMKFSNKRTVSLRIINAVIKDKKILASSRLVEQLMTFTKSLLVDDKDASNKEENFEFEQGQEQVAKLVHLVSHPSNSNIHYDLLLRLKKVFVKGGDRRIKHTLPALIFELIKLSMLMH
mmetsp:Transcript_36506/g.26579  ORF Transcript_36506/g.26579 Transcript_36506/m.26579 type:complete len:149 (+) Transcript_36506:1203-1649(+)|eukprot:CAMPEP_0116879774 /NCGR_PEP_ID=MMETSP0463-20121206/11603_1 /TAXON_ID=181622 /ORGANISM="Strombidinopsis sp, Strain SopsisLIS2011" /LENGTH=148 /DNA_ID=CAMNT_0004529489 /DNA_START=1203 /DNA_END=1649 /DNA_ORIENTATION=+